MLYFETFYSSSNPEKIDHSFDKNIKWHNCVQH